MVRKDMVSIRSRPEGREEPLNVDEGISPVQFQSAPDPKAGRNSRDGSPALSAYQVSIRSRPEGREELETFCTLTKGRKFQSAPDPKAGRNS